MMCLLQPRSDLLLVALLVKLFAQELFALFFVFVLFLFFLAVSVCIFVLLPLGEFKMNIIISPY